MPRKPQPVAEQYATNPAAALSRAKELSTLIGRMEADRKALMAIVAAAFRRSNQLTATCPGDIRIVRKRVHREAYAVAESTYWQYAFADPATPPVE